MTDKKMTEYENLGFAPVSEGSPVEATLLWGNRQTGPAAVMIRVPEGHEEPWHHHSSTYHAVIVKGQFQSRSQDASDSTTVYGPGSYVVQPGGVVHREVNAGKGDLVALVYFDGPIDFVPLG